MCCKCAGNAQWLDKSQQQCLVLWRKLGEWADVLYSTIRQFGLQESVMTLDELSSGDDVKDTGVAAEAVNCAECVSQSLLSAPWHQDRGCPASKPL